MVDYIYDTDCFCEVRPVTPQDANIVKDGSPEQDGKASARRDAIYAQISASLVDHYDTLYYVDIDTGTYTEISSTDDYKKLNVPATGKDFFAESRRSIRRYVHPDDQEKATRLHYKDTMLQNLQNRSSYSVSYRLVVDGTVRYIRNIEILTRDRKHILICIENIDDEVRAQLARQELQHQNVTFTQIAETLAAHYDLIYYVDCGTSHYAELSAGSKSGELEILEEGEDFFVNAQRNADRLIHPEDRDRIKLFLDKDRFFSLLEDRRQLIEDYRMFVGTRKTQYTRMTVSFSSDRTHFIICVENREEEVRREKEHLDALSTANKLARLDILTGTRNKTAYRETEKTLQQMIDEGSGAFGIVICDINDLKLVNDTEGHNAGDRCIKAACRLICRIFAHSPVFRVGGDEFAVVLKEQDYRNRLSLHAALKEKVQENNRIGARPVVASGLAEYEPDTDRRVADVFNRADARMYEDKTELKEQKLLQESRFAIDQARMRIITEERRMMLDSLFRSFDIVSEGTYVFLCDMQYDYSRWSKSAVDAFGLPSEYMYGAGDIWENHIHPEDREAYHKGIEEVFSGAASEHDMQYRVRRPDGQYEVCTCRGVVIRDVSGEPDYFAGSIRNHGLQGHVDALTGLRNQYGFFEDLDGSIRRREEICVVLFGISRFSQINEMYGYHFGNRVLQYYARTVYEFVGNTGHVYRIDGTKFAVISHRLSMREIREGYENFRSYLHENFQADGRKVLLDLHCGGLRVDSFDIDPQTVYSCLNFADEESKLRRQGDLVEFRSEPGRDSLRSLEMLHEIRASIMRGCEGFRLLYQPVVEARTERLVGAEALLRWNSSRYGTVPPDRFIPILESDPLFPELGEWILREAIAGSKKMRQQNPDFVVNVNLSYSQLEKPEFADRVLQILKEQGCPPSQVCLEVTERCRLLDLELLKNVVIRLKSSGIRIALDDFGTGFSSVDILKEIPFDTIKIDRSFVWDIEKKETDCRLVQSLVGLGALFGARVCVEGVETAGMRDILRQFRAHSFQGYYYARPLPPEELLQWKNPHP